MLQRLINSIARGNVEKITGRPDSTHRSTIYMIEDLRFESSWQAVHVRNM
jgi:hypothetical protein